MLINLCGEWLKLLLDKETHDASLNTEKVHKQARGLNGNERGLVTGERGAGNMWKPLKYLHKS